MSKTFEENVKELELIVRELESGEVDLDNALAKYGAAIKLVKECHKKLDNAESQIAKVAKENGELQNLDDV